MAEFIDAEWLKRKLNNQRGLRIKLAESMGVEPNVISKITNGTRQIKGSEIQQVQQFFAERGELDLAGFGESTTPLSPSTESKLVNAEKMRLVMKDLYPEKTDEMIKPEVDTHINLAIVGDKVQVSATVDRDGLKELIRRLRLADQMISES